jgi:hypothetical protein
MRRPALIALVLVAALAATASLAVAAARSPVTRVSITAPSANNLTLAELRFRPGRLDVTARALAPLGLDVVDVAALQPRPHGGGRLLVLVVTRASALDTPASVALRVRARVRLASSGVSVLRDVFAVPSPAGTAAVCDVPGTVAGLAAARLRPLYATAAAIPGYGTAAALAEAYDGACGLPVDAAFKSAVTTPPTQPTPTPPTPPICPVATTGAVQPICCPPNAQCVPLPCPVCGCHPCPGPVQADLRIVCPLTAALPQRPQSRACLA